MSLISSIIDYWTSCALSRSDFSHPVSWNASQSRCHPRLYVFSSCCSSYDQHLPQFYKSAANWTTMVLHGIQALREGAHEDCAPNNSSLDSSATQAALEDSHCNASLNPTATIFTSLVRRQDTIERHKILANFECAAAYLSLILKVSDRAIDISLSSVSIHARFRVSRTFQTRCRSSRRSCIKSGELR